MTPAIDVYAIPIPNGCDGSRVVINVAIFFVATSPTADLPSFVRDYCSLLADAKIRLEIALESLDGQPNPGLADPSPTFAVDARLWATLLKEHAWTSEPAVFGSVYEPLTYSVRSAAELQQLRRCLLAISHTDRTNGPHEGMRRRLKAAAASMIDSDAMAFHGINGNTTVQSIEPRNTKTVDVRAIAPSLHRAPAIGRLCGLIIECRADWPTLNDSTGVLRAVMTGVDAYGATGVPGRTAFRILSNGRTRIFGPLSDPRRGRIDDVRGALVVNSPGKPDAVFAVASDYVGALFKGAFSREADDDSTAVLSDNTGPAAQRTPGISVNIDRAALLKYQDWQYAAQGGQSPLMYAEDLITGYRIDVSIDGKPFSPLCQRDARYFNARSMAFLAAETHESYCEHLPTRDVELDSNFVQYTSPGKLHESIAQWDGWSLVAAKPGRTPSSTTSGSAFVTTNSTVPTSSLTPLRTAHSYQFLVRAAYMTGAGTPMRDIAELRPSDIPKLATAPTTAWRAEPCSSPRVFVENRLTGAEKLLELLVGAKHRSVSRIIYWPTISRELAELLGALDALADQRRKDLVFGRIRTDEPEPAPNLLPDPWVEAIEIEIQLLTRCAQISTAGPAGGDVVVPALSCQEEPHRFKVLVAKGEWPDRRHFEIEAIAIEEGASWFRSPGYDAVAPPGFILKLHVASGDRLSVNLRSVPRAQDVDNFEIAQRLKEHLRAMSRAAISAGITLTSELDQLQSLYDTTLADLAAGRHSAIAPSIALSVVHATKRPLVAPAFGQPAISRDRGATSARVIDTLLVDGATSASLAIEGSWLETQDIPTQPRPQQVARKIVSAPLAIDENAGTVELAELLEGAANPSITSGMTLSFPDTTAQSVSLQAVATSRFASAFPESHGTPNDFTLASPSRSVILNSSRRPDLPKISHAIPLFSWTREQSSSNSIAQRKSHGIRLFIDRPWFSSGYGEMVALTLWPQGVPSLRDSSVELNQVNALAGYVSQWGAEVTTESAGVPEGPYIQHFENAAASASGLLLPSLDDIRGKLGIDQTAPELRVDIVAFEVVFDEARNCWRADINISVPNNPGTWLRLAVARYQPHSVRGCELSQVVAVTYAQLMGDRTLTISKLPENRRHLTILLSGPFANDGDALGIRVTVRLLRNVAAEEGHIFEVVGISSDLKPSGTSALSAYSGTLELPDDCDRMVLEIREEMRELNRPAGQPTECRPLFLDHFPLDRC